MRAKGFGPTLAGSGRCTGYIDEPICLADAQCLWRKQSKDGRPASCALKPARLVIGRGAGKGLGSEAQKAAAAANPWIQRVKAYAAANNVSYKAAMQALKGTGGAKGAMKGGYYY